MLVASMNPCPCGFYNHPDKDCVCTPSLLQKYLNKISSPLLDLIDIHIEVITVPFDKLSEKRNGKSSELIRQRVSEAWLIQEERFIEVDEVHCNARMGSSLKRKHCYVNSAGQQLLKNAM